MNNMFRLRRRRRLKRTVGILLAGAIISGVLLPNEAFVHAAENLEAKQPTNTIGAQKYNQDRIAVWELPTEQEPMAESIALDPEPGSVSEGIAGQTEDKTLPPEAAFLQNVFNVVKVGLEDITSAVEKTTLSVGGGKAIWEPDIAVLTLENVKLSESIWFVTSTENAVPLTVRLKGNNSIDTTQGVDASIIVSSDLILEAEDNASLTITAGSGQNAIFSNAGTVTITGGTLEIKAADYPAIYAEKTVNITGGNLTAESTMSNGIYAGDAICISGAETIVNAAGGEYSALYAFNDIEMTGGKITAKSTGSSSIYSDGSISIAGGPEVHAEGRYGALIAMADIQMTGGKMTAAAMEGSSLYAAGNICITGEGTECDTTGYACALYAVSKVEISGAKVVAHSQNNHVVYTDNGPITIQDHADLTLTSDYADATGLFLYAEQPLTITDSAVHISDVVNGIWSGKDVRITDSALSLNTKGNGIVAYKGELVCGGEKTRIEYEGQYPLYGETAVTITGGYISATTSWGPAISGQGGITVSGGEVHAKATGSYTVPKPAAFYSSQGSISFTGTATVEAISEHFQAVYTDNAQEADKGKIILDTAVTAKAGENNPAFMACSNTMDNTSDPTSGIIIGSGYSAQGYVPVTTKWKEDMRGGYYAYTVLAPAGTENLQEDYTEHLPAAIVVARISREITAAPVRLNFGRKVYGYAALALQTVRITNTGNVVMTLAQPTAVNYTVDTDSPLVLAPGEAAAFTICPKTGFDVGNYGETITFLAEDLEGVTATAEVEAVFSVAAAVPVVPPSSTPTPTPTETPSPTPTPDVPDIDTPVPVKPETIDKTTDTVTIAWKPLLDVDGYTIWIRMEGEKTYTRKEINDAKAKNFTLKGCKPGTKYYFIVKPYKKTADDGRLYSEKAFPIRGTTRPKPAVIDKVIPNISGDLKVFVSGAAGADRYAMCYSKTADFNKYRIGIRTKYKVRTMAQELPDGIYYVKVRAYRQLDSSTRVYGDWSKAVRVTVKAGK